MTEKNDEDIISSLTGTALRVFVYALKKAKDVGVRETQRDLGFKSASHSQYHLQRLEQLGLLEKNTNNRYNLKEEYENLRSLKIGILTEIYVFKGWMIPSLGLFSGFLASSLLITILFCLLLSPLAAVIFGSVALFMSFVYSGYRAYQIIRSFKQSEE
ncbi:MAG: hypothetical protein H7644_01135 [Candidatus Heimdallarchaeota archaeon]|nr:hypothetical protein [Candidatus Heimdallarchaeota archaeon]MCK5142353.1 hypothetical protein [Candidatus Heimdallarchaeota archaeon]